MIVESVNTLAENRPQYRLGDAVLCRNRPCGRQAFELVANNRHLFNGTVLCNYACRIDQSDPDPQWDVLRDVVKEKARQMDLSLPGDDELVIHLRLGDWKGYKLPGERLVNYVVELIDRFDLSISKITIVTAIHFGKLVLEKRLSEEQVSMATSIDISRVKIIMGQFRKKGLSVRIYSSKDIDRDFCFLANSRLLVLGNGYFSLCASMISNARCFVPPWVRKGVKLEIDELLGSRT